MTVVRGQVNIHRQALITIQDVHATGLLVDVSASGFSAGVIIAENGTTIACGPGATGAQVTHAS